MTDNNLIIYEQPFDELTRVCLRLEYLFQQLDHSIKSEQDNCAEVVINYLIDVLNALRRSDLKSKIAKKAHDYSSRFRQLQHSSPAGDQAFNHMVDQLQRLRDFYLSTTGKIAHSLNDDPFISRIRQYFAYSGDWIDIPIYRYWLSLDSAVQKKYLLAYLEQLQPVRQTVDLLLNIARASDKFHQHQSEKGFFHQSLDAAKQWQLLRVGIDKEKAVLPEISAGKHRMSIHFVTASLDDPSRQVTGDLDFYLSFCAI